jgi:hypothetical protein
MNNPDIYEHFTDIKEDWLEKPNQCFSPAANRWIKLGRRFWSLLFILARTRNHIKHYYHNVLHANGAAGSIPNAEIYTMLLDREADTKKLLQGYANVYCVMFKGYSLS